MKKEQFLFLLGGFAFGVLVGYGLFDAVQRHPDLDGESSAETTISSPAGPRVQTQSAPAGAGGAPMVAQINELKRRLQDDPEDLEAAMTLGQTYYRVAQWEQAAQFFEIASGIRPDDPDLLTDWGMALRQMGDAKGALERFRAAHEADNEHWESLFNTAVVLAFDVDEPELAEMAMQRLEALDPLPPQVAELRAAIDRQKAENGAAADGD